jgi:hypothetical protein
MARNGASFTDAYRWVVSSSVLFGVLGLLSLVAVDFMLPRAPGANFQLYFSKEPILLASTSIPPALFACFASLRWLRNDSRLFRGWLSVATFAWTSLVINPVIWLLVLSTFLFYGVIVLLFLLAGGVVLQIAWQLSIRSVSR